MVKVKHLKINIIIFIILLVYFFLRYYQMSALGGFFDKSDTDNYLLYYGDRDLIARPSVDYLYFLFSYLFSLFVSFETYIAFVGVVFFLGVVSFFNKFYGYSYLSPLFLLVCFFYPSYVSLSELVIRQGLAFSILFFFGFYQFSKNKWKRILILTVASLFHIGLIFYFFALVISEKLILKLNNALRIWILIAFLYALDLPLRLVALLSGLSYVGVWFSGYADADYVIGFKISFFLLSALPVIILLFPKFRSNLGRDFAVENLFRFYLISNSLGFLFSGFGYYDRAMLFSWVLIPFLLFYSLWWLVKSTIIRRNM